MAEQEYTSNAAAPPRCEPVGELLKSVINRLNEFEALKLPELRSELEAFVKNQDKLVDEYKKAFPELRDKWCRHQQSLETLYEALKCAFPRQEWKTIVAECICQKQHEIRCRERDIASRKRCCQGKRERARERAKNTFDRARARLDALQANVARIKAAQADHDKWITEVQGLLSRPDKALALNVFWFKLLPSHKAIRPEDVSADCATFGDAESPEQLCKTEWDKPCDTEPGLCRPAEDADAEENADARENDRRRVPSLIPPDDYRTELDCVWAEYKTAKDGFATADSTFREKPDDLASLTALLEQRKKAIEEEIKKCLREATVDDACCTEAGPNGSNNGRQRQGVENA